MSSRRRILIIAQSANPDWASVPLEGWSHAAALADITDAHVVTHIRNRDAIVAAGWEEGKQFTAIDSEAVARPLHRVSTWLRGKSGKAWTIATAIGALSNLYFERLVWKQFGHALRAGKYDLVHRITPLSPTSPSPMASHCRRIGVPFVLGPLNGGLPWPRAFDSERRAEREWLSYVRGMHKLLPGYHATRRNATAIIVGSKATWQQMPKRYHHKCHYIAENGIDPARFTARRTRTARKPIRAVFLGRLVPYKGPDMLLDAAADLLRSGDMTLTYIGDGPLRASLEAQCDHEGVSKAVQFAGWVDHRQVQHHLADADLLTFPSIREFGGAVVLEAMAVGVVPVIVDYGGPSELITPDTGITVPLGSRTAIVAALRDTLTDLINSPSRIDAMSQAAHTHALTQFTWPAKARQVLKVYDQLLAASPVTGDAKSLSVKLT